MEYIHVTLLDRGEDTFDYMTPRSLFAQFDIYKKMNGLEDVDSKKNSKKLDMVEDFF